MFLQMCKAPSLLVDTASPGWSCGNVSANRRAFSMRPGRTLNSSREEKILERDGYMCVYCGGEADCVDHIIPWSWSRDDSEDNLVASCSLCNGIASNLIFSCLSDKYRYIHSKLKRRRKPKLFRMAECTQCKRVFKPRFGGSTVLLCKECSKLADADGDRVMRCGPRRDTPL
jgi:hypothetical protein